MTAAATLPRPLGAYARWRRAGDLVFIAGVSARLPSGEIDGVLRDGDGVRHDVAAQTRRVLQTIAALVQEAGGAGLADCVDMQAFLVHAEDFTAFNAAYGAFFPGEVPTRTTVVVRALPHPDMVVEIKAVACVPVASSQ